MTGVPHRKRKHSQKHREDGPVKMQVEMGGMQAPAEEHQRCWPHQELEEAGSVLPKSSQRKHVLLTAGFLIWRFLNCERINFWFFFFKLKHS